MTQPLSMAKPFYCIDYLVSLTENTPKAKGENKALLSDDRVRELNLLKQAQEELSFDEFQAVCTGLSDYKFKHIEMIKDNERKAVSAFNFVLNLSIGTIAIAAALVPIFILGLGPLGGIIIISIMALAALVFLGGAVSQGSKAKAAQDALMSYDRDMSRLFVPKKISSGEDSDFFNDAFVKAMKLKASECAEPPRLTLHQWTIKRQEFSISQ